MSKPKPKRKTKVRAKSKIRAAPKSKWVRRKLWKGAYIIVAKE